MSNKKNVSNIDKNEINTTIENITKNILEKTFEENNNVIRAKRSESNHSSNINNNFKNFSSEKELQIYQNNSKKYNYTNDIDEEKVEKNIIENDYRKNISKYKEEFFREDDDFEDDDLEYEKGSIFFKVLNFSLIVVLTISTGILYFNLKSTKTKLHILEEENELLIVENENLKLNSVQVFTSNINNDNNEIDLKTELDEDNTIIEDELNDNVNDTANTKTYENNSNNSVISEYTVKENDSFWKISQQIYGNGAYYQKILEANNLTENNPLTPGQILKIPQIN